MKLTSVAFAVAIFAGTGACKTMTLGDRPEDGDSGAKADPNAGGGEAKPEATKSADTAPAPTGHGNVDGPWRSNFGALAFKQSGDVATATFPDGSMDCKWIGERLMCDWKKKNGTHGKAKIWFLSSGELSGDYGFNNETGDGGRFYFAKPNAPKQDWESSSFGVVTGGGSSGGGSKECSFSSECPAGVTCSMNGHCATSAGGSCSSDSDCGGGKCHSGHCSNSPDGNCFNASECTGGQSCNTITHKCGR